MVKHTTLEPQMQPFPSLFWLWNTPQPALPFPILGLWYPWHSDAAPLFPVAVRGKWQKKYWVKAFYWQSHNVLVKHLMPPEGSSCPPYVPESGSPHEGASWCRDQNCTCQRTIFTLLRKDINHKAHKQFSPQMQQSLENTLTSRG